MKSRKVLVIEDHEDMRMLYKVLFRREESIGLLEASSGEEALRIASLEEPDLILVDISLPGISGLDFTRRIKYDFPDVKVLVVTGHDVELFQHEASEAGADDLVTKGDAAQIVERCKKLLQ
ncbi:MAG: response regulator [Chitinispirillaceae bacterium]